MERNSSNATPEYQQEHRTIKREIIKHSEFSVYLQVSLFVYLLTQIESWPISVSFIPLIFYNFKQLLVSAYILKKEGNIVRNFTTKLSGLAFLQQSCDFCSKILLVLYLETGLSLFVAAAVFGIPIILNYYYRNAPYTLFQGYLHILHLFTRLAIILTLILQSIDDLFQIEMSWIQTCLPIIVVLLLGSVMSSFSLIILLLIKAYKILYEESENKSNWTLFVCWICFSYSVFSFYYINSVDDNQTSLIVSTALHNTNGLLIAFWSLLKLRSFSEWAVEENSEEQEADMSQDPVKRILNKGIPTLFMRLSNLLYKPVVQLDIDDIINRGYKSEVLDSEKDNESDKIINCSLPVMKNYDLSIFDIKDMCNSEHCVVCCEKPNDAVLLPCGHGGICFGCSKRIKNDSKQCHICRGEIRHTVQIKQNSSLAYVSAG